MYEFIIKAWEMKEEKQVPEAQEDPFPWAASSHPWNPIFLRWNRHQITPNILPNKSKKKKNIKIRIERGGNRRWYELLQRLERSRWRAEEGKEEGRGRWQQSNGGREKAAPRREAMALVPETREKDETPLLVGWELGRLI